MSIGSAAHADLDDSRANEREVPTGPVTLQAWPIGFDYEEEKPVRSNSSGFKAAVVGAVAGGAGVYGAIATSGSVAGLGATGITSGLAAVGSIVGGGMAAGLAVTAAAPVAAGAIAFGLYNRYKRK